LRGFSGVESFLGFCGTLVEPINSASFGFISKTFKKPHHLAAADQPFGGLGGRPLVGAPTVGLATPPEEVVAGLALCGLRPQRWPGVDGDADGG
jgi:hypothetical protein